MLVTHNYLDVIQCFAAGGRYPKALLLDTDGHLVKTEREFSELFAALKEIQLGEEAAKVGINWTVKLSGVR